MEPCIAHAFPSTWRDFIGSDAGLQDRLEVLSTLLPDDPLVPARAHIFRALEETPPAVVRVVILGQDPYPTPGDAIGLAFAVNAGRKSPRSLRNIYKEIAACCGDTSPGDILGWPRQGVLLLNRWLTFSEDRTLRPRWDAITGLVLDGIIRKSPSPVVVLGWGKPAIEHLAETTPIRSPTACSGPRLFLESTHPSPLSASRSTASTVSFLGAGHFARSNAWLTAQGSSPIIW